VQKVVIEIVIEIMFEMVIEIGMQQTRLFQCNRFHYGDLRDWNRDWIFQKKIRTELSKKSIIERTRLFLCNRFHCAENRQSPSRFFQEGWSLWIFMSRVCYAWRNNQYILAAETVITNVPRAAAAFVYSSDLWRQFYVIVNHATIDLD